MKPLDVITRAGLTTENVSINWSLIIYDSFGVSWQPDKHINKSIVHLWYSLSPYHQRLDLGTFIFSLVKFTVEQRVSAGLPAVHQLQSRKQLDGPHVLEQHSSEVQIKFFCLMCAQRESTKTSLETAFVPWASPPVLLSPQTIPWSLFHFFLEIRMC